VHTKLIAFTQYNSEIPSKFKVRKIVFGNFDCKKNHQRAWFLNLLS